MIAKAHKVPSTPFKSPQVRSSANSIRGGFAHTSYQLRDCFGVGSTSGRFGFGHSSTIRQTTVKEQSNQTRRCPNAVPKQ